ncbi:MAG TPA: hypothetical protein VGP92_04990 [Acidimicrobiia bacterium]|jgi:hypothetical protein|nr:hypothetical protein [Acidimicrobiia bacterium]
MAEDSAEDMGWLLEPPEPGRVQIYVRIGEGAELDEAQRAAIEALVGEVFDTEVEGFAGTVRCRPLSCEPRMTSCLADFCGKFSCDVGLIGGLGGGRSFGAV